MSQPGYGQGGPYPPENNPQQPGWGGAGQPNTPSNEPYGQPGYGHPQPPAPGHPQPPAPGQPQPPAPGQPEPPQPNPGPIFGEQPASGGAPGFGQPPAPASGGAPGFPEQPASGGAPGFGQPPAGGGYGDQAPANPFGPPTSGPGFGDPQQPGPQHTMALPPVGPGGPGGSRFGDEPKPKRGPWLPVLAAVAAVFLILSATMTVLFVQKNGDYNTQKSLAADRQNTINSDKKKIDDLSKKLNSTKKDLDQANRDLDGAQNQNKDLAKEKDVISKCLSLLEQALVASDKGDDKKLKKLVKQLQKPCDEANKYIS